jgi:hypothetical protein
MLNRTQILYQGVRMFRFTLAALALCALTTTTHAGVIVTFQQVGSDVVATGSGSLNVDALTYVANFNITPSIWPALSNANLGAAGNVDRYTGVAGPGIGGVGSGGLTAATSGIGDTFAIRGQATQSIYIGGTAFSKFDSSSNTFKNLSNTTTWANKTISGLGITPGTYTWNWGSGPTADFFTLNAQAAAPAVPEPPSFILFGSGLLALVGYRWWRRNQK